MKKLKSPS